VRGVVQPELAGIGAAVLGHRTGFAPDQLRAAASEAKIAAESQFPRPAVERAVAAFHRVDAPAVANGAATDAQGLEQRRQIVGEAQIDAEPGVLGLQFGDRLVLEEARHGVPHTPTHSYGWASLRAGGGLNSTRKATTNRAQTTSGTSQTGAQSMTVPMRCRSTTQPVNM